MSSWVFGDAARQSSVAVTADTQLQPGIAAICNFTLNKEDPAFGSLLQVGFAFAIGIAFAIITCAPTSGGHFNPAITICFATYQGFPWKKVPYYIFSQVFGAFIAGLLMVGM